MDRADFISAAPGCDTVCLLESASPLQEVVHLSATADGDIRLHTQAAQPLLVPDDRRCRGVAPTARAGALLVASVPAPDPEAAAFLFAPASDTASPEVSVVRPPWLVPKQPKREAQAPLPSLFAVAGGRRSPSPAPAAAAIQVLEDEQQPPTHGAGGASASPSPGGDVRAVQQQLRAMEAGLRRQMKAIEDGVHQRLDRLEMILGLLLQERSAGGRAEKAADE